MLGIGCSPFFWSGEVPIGPPIGGTFTDKAVYPQSKLYIAGDTDGVDLFVFGGGPVTALSYTYDVSGDSWSSITSLTVARSHHAVSGNATKMYITCGTETPNTHEEYDISGDSYSTLAVHPDSRDALTTETIDNFVYSICGEFAGVSKKTCYKYSISGNTWSSISDAIDAIRLHASAVVDGKIYMGGNNVSTYSKHFNVYDPDTDGWTNLADMPAGAYGHSMWGHNGRIYAFGGYDPNTASFNITLYEYTISTNTWTSITTNTNRRLGAYTAVGGEMYIITGFTVSSYTNKTTAIT